MTLAAALIYTAFAYVRYHHKLQKATEGFDGTYAAMDKFMFLVAGAFSVVASMQLNASFTRVLDGMDFVDEITRVAIDHVGRWGPRDRPIENVRILSVRPVGQVAAIRSAMELERQASGQLALAETQTGSTGNAAPTAADTPTGNPATPPAALALEAFRP